MAPLVGEKTQEARAKIPSWGREGFPANTRNESIDLNQICIHLRWRYSGATGFSLIPTSFLSPCSFCDIYGKRFAISNAL